MAYSASLRRSHKYQNMKPSRNMLTRLRAQAQQALNTPQTSLEEPLNNTVKEQHLT